MTLARKIGLNVPDMQYNLDLDAIIIHRYDRQVMADGGLKRLHQNDICQILGLSSKRKYESEGGPSFAQCLHAIMKQSDNPAEDKLRMIEWLIFNLAIGNMDSHAKNISILASDERTRLAPFYDMVCTLAYPHLSQRFAFKIGGENRPGWLRKRHWERFASEVEMPIEDIEEMKLSVCNRIEASLPNILPALRKNIPNPGNNMVESVCVEIRRGTGRLRTHTMDMDDTVEHNTLAARREKM